MTGRLLAAYSSWPLLCWMAGSVLVYAVIVNAAWLGARVVRQRGRRLPAASEWLAEVAALLFFLGVPYLALGGWPLAPFSGLLSLADMGVVGLGGDWPLARWLESAGTGLALGLAALAVLSAGWALSNHGGSPLVLPAWRGWQVLLRGLYQEVHWSFYRAALAVTWVDVYAGTWGALALVLIEWGLNPTWRESWRDPTRAGLPWLGIGLALLSTVLYLLTRNLWMCIALHWLVAASLTAIARRFSESRPAAAAATLPGPAIFLQPSFPSTSLPPEIETGPTDPQPSPF